MSRSEREEENLLKQLELLTNLQLDFINLIVENQERFENASEEDLKKVTPYTLDESERDSLNRVFHMVEMSVLAAKLVATSCKEIFGFGTLIGQDQFELLNANSSAVIMLRTARKYDKEKDVVILPSNQSYSIEQYCKACEKEFGEALFDFCRNMHSINVCKPGYALLTAIVIFSDVPNLTEPKKVEKLRNLYNDALKSYAIMKLKDENYYAQLKGMLIPLRKVADMHSNLFVRLKPGIKLPPLLEEFSKSGAEYITESTKKLKV